MQNIQWITTLNDRSYASPIATTYRHIEGLAQNGFTVENSLNSFFEKLTSRKRQRHIGKHVNRILW